MTIFERDAKTLELPWPFTGREDELELIRRSSAAGHHGIVVTGPVGCGKTRLVTEAVRGTDCARVAGTPETRHLPFAAFAHLLPETVSLHRAVQLLSAVRLLLVDDAHLLDDASAALVHQLAVHGRTRLLVVATDGVRAPGAVSRLWTGELLPRLALEPLPHEETAQLLAAGVGGGLEPLTVNRLHRLCRGDLRLLREVVGAVREGGLLGRVPGSDEWAWRGPVPVTATVRERTAGVLDRRERETLELLAFAEPLTLDMEAVDLRVLEDLEAEGMVRVDDHGGVRLAHPLHGPVLRAAAGRLRARRLARTPEQCKAALEEEAAELSRRMERADVTTSCAPVGEWLVAEGEPVPAWYAAVRARFARLRGELREAAAWAREGLRDTAGDASCRAELALAVLQSGELADTDLDAGPRAEAWRAAARGDLDTALEAVSRTYDAVRLGAPGRSADAGPLGWEEAAAPGEGTDVLTRDVGPDRDRHAGMPAPGDGPRWGRRAVSMDERVPARVDVFALHADALARADGPALDRVAERLEERGFLLFAAEACAQAVHVHSDPRAARTSRTRAVALARRCQGARTPALSGLVLGELTARQRQIVTLAAAGLSNRQIAEKLTLSIRTVGNHLYSAYARLGAGGRGALPWLVELPDAQPA
ncbi:LuxR C-terminal-related transcriptional regulator [Streptomyces sp. WM6386]|uniref:LuxR C-terminal-related transcriptional regulator n=1 Tax=Streptomyces sp. WM6386 TaxID=1415558 RepID=UPI0006199562|nr:LuxR C-terminal-related transcriptional regulator [Streptomyces sp. WM6386]KKD08730.1 regulatory protein [Streptomyces sp. WM6386]